MITVAVVDNDKYVLDSLGGQVRRLADDIVLNGLYSSVEELRADAAQPAVSVVLLDVRLARGSTFAANLASLLEHGSRVVAITSDTQQPQIVPALRENPVSILHKDESSDPTLDMVIRLTANGGRYVTASVQSLLDRAGTGKPMPKLTNRQDEVLHLCATGMPPTFVARKLFITPRSLHEHLEEIERRFEAAGHHVRDDAGQNGRNRAWILSRKAIDIGYIVDPRDED